MYGGCDSHREGRWPQVFFTQRTPRGPCMCPPKVWQRHWGGIGKIQVRRRWRIPSSCLVGGLEVIETLAMVFNDSKMQPCLNGGKASRVLYQGPTVSLSTPSLPLPLPRVTCMRQMWVIMVRGSLASCRHSFQVAWICSSKPNMLCHSHTQLCIPHRISLLPGKKRNKPMHLNSGLSPQDLIQDLICLLFVKNKNLKVNYHDQPMKSLQIHGDSIVLSIENT